MCWFNEYDTWLDFWLNAWTTLLWNRFSLSWEVRKNRKSRGINLVRESPRILLMAREKWRMAFESCDCCLFFVENKRKYTFNASIVSTKCRWKGVGVGEMELTKNYMELVLAPQMGQGIMRTTVREFHFWNWVGTLSKFFFMSLLTHHTCKQSLNLNCYVVCCRLLLRWPLPMNWVARFRSVRWLAVKSTRRR